MPIVERTQEKGEGGEDARVYGQVVGAGRDKGSVDGNFFFARGGGGGGGKGRERGRGQGAVISARQVRQCVVMASQRQLVGVAREEFATNLSNPEARGLVFRTWATPEPARGRACTRVLRTAS